jgi:aminoglycoside phosphotransferase (APT) family kinase protein
MPLAESRLYSERLGVITAAQLQRACDHMGLGALIAAEPASAGQWGQNIFLTTAAGEYVLRGNPQPAEQLARERAVAAAVNERSSLAAPWPYELSADIEIFGWPYAVMPVLPGTMGATFWDDADDDGRIDLARAHGQALARLHEATFVSPGPYDADADAFVAVDDFAMWTLQRLGSLRERCRSIDALGPDDARYIDQLIDSCSPALAEPFVPVVVHHDFSLANTNYELIGGRYQVTGVFDLGEAHIGDGDEDLVRFLFRRRRAQREAFVESYAAVHPFRAGAEARLQLYALADVLVMWEVSRRTTNWFGHASFMEIAVPVIENARRAVP